nr:hypothetical protein CFP56_09170 [Quercus suber]
MSSTLCDQLWVPEDYVDCQLLWCPATADCSEEEIAFACRTITFEVHTLSPHFAMLVPCQEHRFVRGDPDRRNERGGVAEYILAKGPGNHNA